ncbi:FAD-dependent oxidoreductase [Noviherbaspirillum cavernae]|uniref:Tryptophan 2-monooxygenase n=1 Tax=Noviherbaspirillum cavernae TaxID=2320862 RepID=A0A418X4Y6_9BURK|nr:NAD(P)/FAD-dependent oxidoreductase [Noviherbaspirillum cavernae]RJG07547.1 FAD-dependent oxidoreductase [Noviherbaspirillum cavernae]
MTTTPTTPILGVSQTTNAVAAQRTISQPNTAAVMRQSTLTHLEHGPVANNGRPLPTSKATPIGTWPKDDTQRAHVAAMFNANLGKLANTPKGEQRLAFQREVHAHWQRLSDKEKVDVLNEAGKNVKSGGISRMPTLAEKDAHALNERLATLSEEEQKKELEGLSAEQRKLLDAPKLRGPAVNWLHHTLAAMSPAARSGLFQHVDSAAKEGLELIRTNKPNQNFIDTDYDYKSFLKFNENPITLPPEARGKEVLIVGTGAAAATAARMLLQAGAKVTMVEAEDRRGGRLESRHYTNTNGTTAPEFSEMGAMRFPPTGRTWFHFLKQFGVKTISDFPNPGKVPTKLFFKGETIDWKPGAPTPDSVLLKQVGADFGKFASRLTAPIEEARKAHDSEKLEKIWQGYIDKYEGKSFFAAVKEGMQELGIKWGKDQLDAFGALGIGTGGFGPLYPVGFLEILRVMVNKLDDDQHLLPKGTTDALDHFYTAEMTDPAGNSVSLEKNAEIRLTTTVTGIEANAGKSTVKLKAADGTVQEKGFAAVVVTASPVAMERMGMSLPARDSDPVLSKDVASAITDLHLMNSSKLFIRTEKKFWLDDQGNPRKDIPQTIQTDQSPHGIYCLGYPGTDHGVVLVSYTWGDKSTKLLGLKPEERLEEFKKVIAQVSPEFAENLVPLNGELHNVDWQTRPTQFGAFKLNNPGQEPNQHAAFYQYQSAEAKDPQPDSGVYLAGDGVSHTGGWVEGAVTTGINAAVAAALHLGGAVADGSPMDIRKDKYNYEGRSAA